MKIVQCELYIGKNAFPAVINGYLINNTLKLFKVKHLNSSIRIIKYLKTRLFYNFIKKKKKTDDKIPLFNVKKKIKKKKIKKKNKKKKKIKKKK